MKRSDKIRRLLRCKKGSAATWIWLALLAASLGLRLYKIGELPLGMDFDQVREAYDASVLLRHFDVILDSLLFIHLFSLNMFQRVWGFTALSNQLNANFWFLMALIPLYALIKDLFGKASARWGIILLSFSVISFTATHIGHIAITAPFFAFWGLWAYYRLLRTGQYRYVILSGLALGLGIYSAPSVKGVLLTIPGFFVMLIGLERGFRLAGLRNIGNAVWKFFLVASIFLGVVCFFGVTLANHPFSLQRLSFILFGYTSNGRFISSFAELHQNMLRLLSQFLPVKYVRYHHFIIHRFTGHAEAIFYISPLITLCFLMFLGWFVYQIGRLLFKQFQRSYLKHRPPSKQRWIVTTWQPEYDWLFAGCMFLGGCSTALLSDHTAARRWIYGWFLLYPLAAAGLVWTFQRFSKTLLGVCLTITILSQVALIYYPYLFKPWRTTGPTPAVIEEMARYCERYDRVYVNALLYHWARFYLKEQPLGACKLEIISGEVPADRAPYVIFDLINNYGPVPFPGYARMLGKQDQQKGMFIKEFRDSVGFHDFKVIESLPE